MAATPVYKVCVLGSAGSGKTTWLRRHATGEFVAEHTPTVGVEVLSLTFNTTRGPITFQMWDMAGTDKFAGLGEDYLLNADAAVVFFDVTDKSSYKAVKTWFDMVESKDVSLAVLVGSKVDSSAREVSSSSVTFHRKRNVQYYEISSKSNYNFEKPFLYLARRLTNDRDLQFVETVETDELAADAPAPAPALAAVSVAPSCDDPSPILTAASE
ncbi:GTP-binding nuclear protein Ran-4 [Thecamonas trahens ATCC 50062]|uniref:GTP-binding nuclear protein Ran-4 n=1 Tax=Thecamonas trahens ATCC 50062 TaxID=461836 RepID=A0A0L0DBA5_THETB|nr:GTP-binding nuclear protein Ran-4 [Thecamonas trahens ATCC 50062]KNC49607.1 GTP-binding nuclear protein Ran-4 [Thecamonas trahens ATCC 50062]|eukprot:XP_013757714.1 GTP-binding nuclear protein Ran-4 [Thecamonas trahens ATCC 50062]